MAYYESIADTEKWAKCLIDFGLIFVRQGLSEKALATAQRAKSLNLGNEKTLSQLSTLMSSLKLYDEALECHQKVVECEEREHGRIRSTMLAL